MPTHAQLKKRQDIRDYFRKTYAGRIDDVILAKKDITERFGVQHSQWYNIRPELQKINDEAMAGNGTLVKAIPEQDEPEVIEVSVPAGLSSEAKEVVNRLLKENEHLKYSLSLKEIELAGVRQNGAGAESRIRVLKDIATKLIEKM